MKKRLTDVNFVTAAWIVATLVFFIIDITKNNSSNVILVYTLFTVYALFISIVATYRVMKAN